jgi:phage terminase large subunit-like protein
MIQEEINKEALELVINGSGAERIYLCEKSFPLFFIYYFCDYIKSPFAPFHYDFFQDLADLQSDVIREVAWIAFRESAKTSIAKAFVLYCIAYKKFNYINVDSFDKENSERLLFDVVIEMQTNRRVKADFGELFTKRNDEEAKTQKRVNNFVCNNGVRVEAHSTQESVRGRIHGHQRPDLLLLDDFETNKTKDSKAYTEQVISHINEFKSGLDGRAKIIYLGNYITEFGSIQTLIERSKTDPRLRIRMISAIEGNQPTWPSKYCLTDEDAQRTGLISLEDKRRQLGSAVFSVEMLNQPIDEESQEFFQRWFKKKPREFLATKQFRKFVSIDTAMSKSDSADFTGIIKNHVDELNNWFIQAKKYKINPRELINLIFKFHEEGYEKIGVEETVYLDAIKPFIDEEMAKRNKYPRIIPLKHHGIKKEQRIRGLIPKYEAGQIYHIEGECLELEEELVRFPKAPHDDLSDAMAYQIQIAEQGFGGSASMESDFKLYSTEYL